MPYTERRFFVMTVEHAIANAIMLVLFGGISFGIYLVHHTIHTTIIYGLSHSTPLCKSIIVKGW